MQKKKGIVEVELLMYKNYNIEKSRVKTLYNLVYMLIQIL
jgi:hypothetical protein